MSERFQALDAARGLALSLMMLSHSMRLLSDRLFFLQQGPLTVFGMTLIVSKLATPLFVLVSGVAVCHVYVHRRPFVLRRALPRLWRRALLIFAAYRLCAFFELVSAPGKELTEWWPPNGNSWSEILSFYTVVFLAAPFVMWFRFRFGAVAMACVAIAALIGSLLVQPRGPTSTAGAFLFGGTGSYFVPLLAYFPLFLVGIVLEDLRVALPAVGPPGRHGMAALALVTLAVLIAGMLTLPDWHRFLLLIQMDQLKYPPQLPYRLFSFGLAIIALGTVFSCPIPLLARPLAVIGVNPLLVFVAHFAVLFLVLDRTLGLRGGLQGPWPLAIGWGMVLGVGALSALPLPVHAKHRA